MRNGSNVGKDSTAAIGKSPRRLAIERLSNLERFLDEISARLTLAAAGVDIYMALADKESGIPRSMKKEMRAIRDAHQLQANALQDIIRDLGGNLSYKSPVAVVLDTSFQSLVSRIRAASVDLYRALRLTQIFALSNIAGWEILVDVAQETGYGAYRGALDDYAKQERQHAERVRRWLDALDE